VQQTTNYALLCPRRVLQLDAAHISIDKSIYIYIYIYSYKVEIGIYGLHGVCVMWIDLICLSLSSRKLNYYKG